MWPSCRARRWGGAAEEFAGGRRLGLGGGRCVSAQCRDPCRVVIAPAYAASVERWGGGSGTRCWMFENKGRNALSNLSNVSFSHTNCLGQSLSSCGLTDLYSRTRDTFLSGSSRQSSGDPIVASTSFLMCDEATEEILGVIRIDCQFDADLVVPSYNECCGMRAASADTEVIPMVTRRFLRT